MEISPLYSVQITSAFYIVWKTPKCCPSPCQYRVSHITKQRTRQHSSQKNQRDLSLCPLLPCTHKPVLERAVTWHYFYLSIFYPLFFYFFVRKPGNFLTALASVSAQNAMPQRPKSAVTSRTPLQCWNCQTSLSKRGQLPAHKAFIWGWVLIPAFILNVVAFYR